MLTFCILFGAIASLRFVQTIKGLSKKTYFFSVAWILLLTFIVYIVKIYHLLAIVHRIFTYCTSTKRENLTMLNFQT